MALEPRLVELARRQSEPKIGVRPRSVRMSCELRGDDVDDETEPRLPRELEAMLGFALHLDERIARRKKVRVQIVAAVRGIGEVADFVRRHRRRAAADRRPARTCLVQARREPPKHIVDLRLEALQPALLHQVEPSWPKRNAAL